MKNTFLKYIAAVAATIVVGASAQAEIVPATLDALPMDTQFYSAAQVRELITERTMELNNVMDELYRTIDVLTNQLAEARADLALIDPDVIDAKIASAVADYMLELNSDDEEGGTGENENGDTPPEPDPNEVTGAVKAPVFAADPATYETYVAEAKSAAEAATAAADALNNLTVELETDTISVDGEPLVEVVTGVSVKTGGDGN